MKDYFQDKRLWWAALALSLLLHLMMVTGVSFFPEPMIQKPNEVISFEILDKSPELLSKSEDKKLEETPKEKIKKAEQIVESSGPKEEELNRQATLLSEANHKIKKETVAQNIGAFRNSGKTGPKGNSSKNNSSKNIQNTPIPVEASAKKTLSPKVDSQTDSQNVPRPAGFIPKLDVDGFFAKSNNQKNRIQDNLQTLPNHDNNLKSQDSGETEAKEIPMNGPQPESASGTEVAGTADPSQTQDYLKDKDKGIETMLNTREFKYYSYYSRIRRQLSEHWEGRVREKILQIYRSGRSIATNRDHITKLLIILNSTGILMNIKILGDSGVRDLDDAAIEAFRSAAPFPNPPRGIIETDGTVHIRWDMVLET